MKEIIQHPTLGEIVYEESFWTGKKALQVNGVVAQAVSKKEFLLGGEKVTVTGGFFAGVNLQIGDERIELMPKSKWYETVIAILPVIFLLTWGNSPALVAIFPVVGGALGGLIGGLALCLSIMLMRKTKSPGIKLLIGLAVDAVAILLAFVLAVFVILTLI